MRPAPLRIAGLIAEAFLLAISASSGNVEADKGRDVFARRCSGCHASDANKEGPRLRGVFGRQSAIVSGFPYSDALKKLNLRWDDDSLDRWLTDPDAMAPDTDMAFRLNSAEERKAVIVYLKSLR
jgi:cytochrome c